MCGDTHMHVGCRSSDLVVEDRFELFLGRHHQSVVAGSVKVVVGSHHSSARRQHEVCPTGLIVILVRA